MTNTSRQVVALNTTPSLVLVIPTSRLSLLKSQIQLAKVKVNKVS